MKLLLDTHVFIWGAVEPERLSRAARALIEDEHNDLLFSAVSLWEIAIKAGLRRSNFQIDVGELRRNLFDNGYSEIAASGAHAVLSGLSDWGSAPASGLEARQVEALLARIRSRPRSRLFQRTARCEGQGRSHSSALALNGSRGTRPSQSGRRPRAGLSEDQEASASRPEPEARVRRSKACSSGRRRTTVP